MNRFITRWDEPFAGKEKLGVNICWHGIHSDIHDRAGRSQKLLPVLSTRSYFTLACWQARTTDVFRFFTAVRKIIPGITCKRSITTITRNPYRSPKFSDGSCYSVDNAGKKKVWYRPKYYYTNSFHLRVSHPPRRRSFYHGRMLWKNLAPRLPKVRPISTFHMKQPEYLENVQRIFWRPQNFFYKRYIPNWFVYRNNTQNWHVHQKINLAFSNISNPLFVILCTSGLPFPLRCCITKRRAKTAGKTRNTTDFHTNSNRLEDISNPPCCDVTILFYTFPKVKKLWTAYEHCLRYSRCFKTFNNNLNTVNLPPLIRSGLNTFTLQGVFRGLKKLRCLYFRGGWLITGVIKALLNKDKLIEVLIKIRSAREGLIIACISLFTSRWACGLGGGGGSYKRQFTVIILKIDVSGWSKLMHAWLAGARYFSGLKRKALESF